MKDRFRGITVREVAEEAGVGIGTISGIFNNLSGEYGSEAEERVRRALVGLR